MTCQFGSWKQAFFWLQEYGGLQGVSGWITGDDQLGSLPEIQDGSKIGAVGEEESCFIFNKTHS